MLKKSDDSESDDNIEFDDDIDDSDADPDYVPDDKIEIDHDLVLHSPIQEIECRVIWTKVKKRKLNYISKRKIARLQLFNIQTNKGI